MVSEGKEGEDREINIPLVRFQPNNMTQQTPSMCQQHSTCPEVAPGSYSIVRQLSPRYPSAARIQLRQSTHNLPLHIRGNPYSLRPIHRTSTPF